MKINIYRMNDTDWVAAQDPVDAIRCLKETFQVSWDDLFGEYLEECTKLTPDELMSHTFHRENNTTCTFNAELRAKINAGESFPQFFASTEF